MRKDNRKHRPGNKLRRQFVALTIGLCLCLTTRAQMGEQYYNLAVGINGGVNVNNVSFSPSVRQKKLLGANCGVTLRYISEKYFAVACGAQVEINLSQHGWSESYEDFPQLQYTRKMNYVEIPFLAHIAYGRDKGMRIFLNLGPQIGFLVNDKRAQSGNWEDVTEGIVEQHEKRIENRFDYGITGGLGAELRTKAGNFIVEGRYYYGLADFYNSTKKDYFARSAHNTIVAKVTYLFDLTH